MRIGRYFIFEFLHFPGDGKELRRRSMKIPNVCTSSHLLNHILIPMNITNMSRGKYLKIWASKKIKSILEEKNFLFEIMKRGHWKVFCWTRLKLITETRLTFPSLGNDCF